MTTAAFVIPGDISLPTGGYAYDRRVLAGLAAHGVTSSHVALTGGYPAPSGDDLVLDEQRLAAQPDGAVLLIDGLAFGAMPGDLIARLRQRIVALVHHPLCLETGLAPMRARYLQQTEQMALALAEHVIVTSPTTGRMLAADFGVPAAKLTVAVPGTDPAAKAIGTGQPVQILAVGSIVARKAYDVLALALRQLPMEPPWRLTIVGADRDETARANLDKALAWKLPNGEPMASRVSLAGAVDDRTLAALYAQADVFVMSSLYEGFGMVLTEAMARGLPIVCTTGGAAAETVPDAAAVKVLPGDAAALGQGLASLIANADLRVSLGQASWTAGQTLATWDDTARVVASVLKRVAA